jgi:hypothetical protein
LEQEISLYVKGIAKPFETDYETPSTAGKSSRTKLVSEDSSERRKRRKSKGLRKTVGFPEQTHTTKMRLRFAGKSDAARNFSET